MDWSRRPLGTPETWPQSLPSTLSMLLPSKPQIILFWGPEFTVLCSSRRPPTRSTRCSRGWRPRRDDGAELTFPQHHVERRDLAREEAVQPLAIAIDLLRDLRVDLEL
jgi:hypothetical protein